MNETHTIINKSNVQKIFEETLKPNNNDQIIPVDKHVLVKTENFIQLFIQEAVLRAVEHKKGSDTHRNGNNVEQIKLTEEDLSKIAGILLLDT